MFTNCINKKPTPIYNRNRFDKFYVRKNPYDNLNVKLILFAGDDSFAGAYRSASTTVDANIGVDNIDITFRDSLYGTFGKASAASNTFVSNNVRHTCL